MSPHLSRSILIDETSDDRAHEKVHSYEQRSNQSSCCLRRLQIRLFTSIWFVWIVVLKSTFVIFLNIFVSQAIRKFTMLGGLSNTPARPTVMWSIISCCLILFFSKLLRPRSIKGCALYTSTDRRRLTPLCPPPTSDLPLYCFCTVPNSFSKLKIDFAISPKSVVA